MSGTRIFLSSPDVGELEQAAVVRAMQSGWIAPLGPDVDAFEAEMAARVGVDHAVALSSGTAALHVGLVAMGVGPGDIVVTSSMTFAATVNAILYTGAVPHFVDSDPVTGNMDPALLADALASIARAGDRASVVLPVDLLGKVADHEAIGELAASAGARVFVDAAESVGASRNGRPAGSFGHASVFSFNGNKIMTTSGGGMLLSNDEDLTRRARYLSTQARQPALHYEHTEVGYNYRLSNILAALGRAQLSRLDAMIDRRRRIRAQYEDLFAGVPGVTLFGREGDAEDNAWLTSILVDPRTTGWSTGELAEWLAADDIESRPLWKPMHLQPAFRHFPATLSGASHYLFETGLTLPSGSVLTEIDIERVRSRISAFLSR